MCFTWNVVFLSLGNVSRGTVFSMFLAIFHVEQWFLSLSNVSRGTVFFVTGDSLCETVFQACDVSCETILCACSCGKNGRRTKSFLFFSDL